MFLPTLSSPTDLDENRLRVAAEMGADHTVKVTTRDSRALAQQIRETLGCQPTQSIECSGAEPSIATAIYVWLEGFGNIFTSLELIKFNTWMNGQTDILTD